jgi:hypothetical protein
MTEIPVQFFDQVGKQVELHDASSVAMGIDPGLNGKQIFPTTFYTNGQLTLTTALDATGRWQIRVSGTVEGKRATGNFEVVAATRQNKRH